MELSKGKILVTGSGGFIGSHLVELCCKNGTDVRAFVRYNSKNSWGWLESSPCKNDIEIITGDIRDYDSVRKAVEGCSTVFHLAALIGIPYSYESPIAYVKTNIEGTYNVLEAAKAEQCQNILVTSTSETYGSAQYVPIDEKHPMVGQSPYSATKIGADHLALSYFRSFDLPVKIVRPFNTYGPRQSARAIIPTTITQILSGNTQLRLGNTSPTRDLTFVKDTAEGFWEIARSDHLFGEITNIGMGKEISIGELVRLIAELMDVEVTIITEEERVRPDKSEVMRLLCDSSKLRAKTEWRPAYDLGKGLLETIEWLKDKQHLYKPEIYNV